MLDSHVALNLASYILLSHTTLKLMGLVNFYNVIIQGSIISLVDIRISGTVTFSYNNVHQLISFDFNDVKYIIMKENCQLTINIM